jgi:hypothetical protein
VIMTMNPKASTSGANVAVSGYMMFLLYSEALLACMSPPSSLVSSDFFLTLLFLESGSGLEGK